MCNTPHGNHIELLKFKTFENSFLTMSKLLYSEAVAGGQPAYNEHMTFNALGSGVVILLTGKEAKRTFSK